MEDRAWAEGLSEQEFVREYQRRFPWGADVIPTVGDYLKPYFFEQRGIDKFHQDSMIEDEEGKITKEEEPKVDRPTVLFCRGCKMDIKNSKGTSTGLEMIRSNHEKKCEKFQDTRTRASL